MLWRFGTLGYDVPYCRFIFIKAINTCSVGLLALIQEMQAVGSAVMPYAIRAGKSLFRRYLGRFSSKRRIFKKRRFVKSVRSAIGYKPEYKYIDSGFIGYVPVTGGGLNCYNQIAEGSDFNQRIGRSVCGKYIQVSLLLKPPTTAGYYDACRVSLVYDKCSTGGASFGSVFDTTGSAYPYTSFKNIATNADRFLILHEERAVVANGNPDTPQIINFNYTIPEHLSKTIFSSSSSATPTTGAWYLCFSSNANTGTSNYDGSWNGIVRFAYMDF